MIGAVSEDQTTRAQSQVIALLRDRHHIEPGTEDDFNVRNLSDIAATMTQATGALTLLLAAIAAVSLLVGGIGIMNIMLVSVTERTREIGLRMAVGAKPRNILAQFLAEALALSVSGGIVGIILGIAATQILARRFGWTIPIRLEVIAIAVGFSVSGGRRLRAISRAQGLAPGSDRCAALRINALESEARNETRKAAEEKPKWRPNRSSRKSISKQRLPWFSSI